MQEVMRAIDKQSSSYGPETVYINKGRKGSDLWREYTADDLDSMINPY